MNIFGGIEGGASKSSAVLFNQTGEKLISVEGPHTNHWCVGMAECQKRIYDLINKAKSDAGIPSTVVLKSLGLSLSGCEGDKTSNELRNELMKNYPNLSEDYVVWSDTVAPIYVAHEDGGAVLISGTGTNCLLVNPDGSQYQCGGMGHLLGDEGGAYWLAVKLIKVYLDDQDNFIESPEGFSTAAVWECVKKHLKVETSFDLLPHFYRNFDKSKIALLTKEFSNLALEGDDLCCWGFREAGKVLAKYILAVAKHADQRLLNGAGGLQVVCVGSVWKSWELMQAGFVKQIESAETNKILKEISLITLTTDIASGAAFLAAKGCGLVLPKNTINNFKVFYHYKRTL